MFQHFPTALTTFSEHFHNPFSMRDRQKWSPLSHVSSLLGLHSVPSTPRPGFFTDRSGLCSPMSPLLLGLLGVPKAPRPRFFTEAVARSRSFSCPFRLMSPLQAHRPFSFSLPLLHETWRLSAQFLSHSPTSTPLSPFFTPHSVCHPLSSLKAGMFSSPISLGFPEPGVSEFVISCQLMCLLSTPKEDAKFQIPFPAG